MKTDTSQALAALKELQAEAEKTQVVVADFRLRGKDLIATADSRDYRNR